jgi:L-ectoine synthase
MFIRTLEGLAASGLVKSLVNGTFRSARFLTAADGMGFSYNDNRVTRGANATLWLKHHWEANYIVSGKGWVTDLTTGEVVEFGPGVLYVVGPNDRHRFETTEDEHHISIFWPPLRGDEYLDKDGSYEASGPGPKTDRHMFVKRRDGQARTIRMLTAADDIGFGLSDVRFSANAEATLWYKHHWEANHILSGTGQVTDLTTGESWKLEPGMAYNVGPRDRHTVRAHSDLHLISIFNPPLRGDEQHDEEGTLPPSGPVPPGPRDR